MWVVPSIPPALFLMLSGILFTIGVIGALTRRNAIIVFMSIELMLNAVNLSFVTLSRFLQSMDGILFAFFVMAVAAAEAAVGLAIFVMIYRSRETINVDEINLLKW
jgi:NADH-quinone oxidoreductase subunit K